MTDTLSVWIEGINDPIGLISRGYGNEIHFEYIARSYPAGWRGISLSLPLIEGRFKASVSRAFFENLLQENDVLEDQLTKSRIDPDDLFRILELAGKDCAGAISVTRPFEPPVKQPGRLHEDYNLIHAEDLDEIVRRLSAKESLADTVSDPSPVAGVQRKVCITYSGGHYFFPKPGTGAPTTHILKVPRPERLIEAELEDYSMFLANQTGLTAAQTETYQSSAGLPYLLVERFDRHIEGDIIQRIHQEDFCQALGLPRRLKYERDNQVGEGEFSARRCAPLFDQMPNPANQRFAFLTLTLFNYLMGNSDNHAKNHGILYTGTQPSLAPAYDILPTRLDPTLNTELALGIGGVFQPSELSKDAIAQFCVDIGFASPPMENVRALATNLIQIIEPQIAEFEKEARFRTWGHLFGETAETLIEALNLNICIRQRDAFILRPSAW